MLLLLSLVLISMTFRRTQGTSTTILMASDSDSDTIILISSDESDDDDPPSFDVEIKQAHKRTLVIPLRFWHRHRLDSRPTVYMRFGNASRSFKINLTYTHEYRRGCSDSLKLTTGWPEFFTHCHMLMKEIWTFTIVSNMYGPQRRDFLIQADLRHSNYSA